MEKEDKDLKSKFDSSSSDSGSESESEKEQSTKLKGKLSFLRRSTMQFSKQDDDKVRRNTEVKKSKKTEEDA